MKLPKSYIKKYGVSKMAWSEYKKSLKRASNKRKKAQSRPRVKTKTNKRSVRYTMPKKKKKSSRRSSKFSGMGKYVGAAVYGAIRERMSNALDPVSRKVPLGTLADEATMLGALYVGKKFLGRKVPLVSEVAKAGMLIESARIGETIAKGQLNLAFGGASAGSSGGDIIG